LAFAEGDFVIGVHIINYIGIMIAFAVMASILTILSLLDTYLHGNTSKTIGKRFILPITYLFAVSVFTAPVFYLSSENLQLTPFCLMNRREPICTEKRKELDCFNKGNDLSTLQAIQIYKLQAIVYKVIQITSYLALMNDSDISAMVSGRTGYLRTNKARTRCSFATSLPHYIVTIDKGSTIYQPDNFVLIDGKYVRRHYESQIWDKNFEHFYDWTHNWTYGELLDIKNRPINPITHYSNETTFIIHTNLNSDVNIELISTKWKLYDDARSSG